MASSRRTRQLPGLSLLRPQPAIPGFIDSAVVSPRAEMDDIAATKQMARDMQEASHREGGMTRSALELLGYTPQQIDRLAGAAGRKAQVLAGMTF